MNIVHFDKNVRGHHYYFIVSFPTQAFVEQVLYQILICYFDISCLYFFRSQFQSPAVELQEKVCFAFKEFT